MSLHTITIIDCDDCGLVPLSDHHPRNRCPKCHGKAVERACTDVSTTALVQALLGLLVEQDGKELMRDYLDAFEQLEERARHE